MPHANEALIRDWFAAQARADEAALRALMTTTSSGTYPAAARCPHDYTGPDAVLGFLARPRELSNGTVRPEFLDLMATDTHAIALVRVHAERPGKKLSGSLQAWAFRITDARIAEFWFLVEDRYAVDAFWSD